MEQLLNKPGKIRNKTKGLPKKYRNLKRKHSTGEGAVNGEPKEREVFLGQGLHIGRRKNY